MINKLNIKFKNKIFPKKMKIFIKINLLIFRKN